MEDKSNKFKLEYHNLMKKNIIKKIINHDGPGSE